MDLDAGNCPIRVLETASPHTDDSTLIEAPGEKVLFVGDATCGAFSSWEKEPALCRQLAETIRLTDAETCVEGHWTPVTKEAMIMDLLEDAGMEQEDRRAFFQ